MTGVQILALVAFVALTMALLLVLRGIGQVIAATRADEAFRRSTADLVGRALTDLGGVLELADGARYRPGPQPDLERTLILASPRIAGLVGEARGLPAPVARGPDREAIARDLAAAADALDALAGGLPGDTDGATERRTALKRGYLALAHATRSLADHGATLASDPPRPDRRRRQR